MIATLRAIRRRLSLAIYPEWISEGASSQERRETDATRRAVSGPRRIKNLIRLADLYGDHNGLLRSAVMGRLLGDIYFFPGLRRDGGCKTATYQRVLKIFSDHWPSDLAWPSDIPRPKPGQSPDRPVKEQAA